MLRRACHIIVMMLFASLVAACGREGPPLSPYEEKVKKAKAENKPAPPPPVKEREFILDALLD